MTRAWPNVFRWHHVLLAAVIAVGAWGLYEVFQEAERRLLALTWMTKTPELPEVPPPLAEPVLPHALAQTRDRPLFWESRRPPPPKPVAGVSVEPPRLLGIATDPSGTGFALLATGVGAARKVYRLRSGQAVGAFSVKTVGAQTVELTGPDGVLNLSMPRATRP